MNKSELCAEIEKIVGRTMCTPKDFDGLVEIVYSRTRERVSASTLKRLWGYLDNDIQPRKFTMDVLARFAGYADYEAFEHRTKAVESNLVLARKLNVDELSVGQRVKLAWQPDRVCIVEHRGDGRFVVVSARNTKLCEGDTFRCHLFIEHEPLFLDDLIHCGGAPTAYVAGTENGIMFEVIDD